MRKIAVRNLRLCTKDCLCLYVCPVGATDTENSVIDVEKCIGCGICAESCPSKAISMVPLVLPPQQKKRRTGGRRVERGCKEQSKAGKDCAATFRKFGERGLYPSDESSGKVQPPAGGRFVAGGGVYAAAERKYASFAQRADRKSAYGGVPCGSGKKVVGTDSLQ